MTRIKFLFMLTFSNQFPSHKNLYEINEKKSEKIAKENERKKHPL